MGLLDDLRTAAGNLDPSLAPSSNEVGPLLGALVAYTEHGDAFLEAAENGAGKVSELLSVAPEDASAPAAPEPKSRKAKD